MGLFLLDRICSGENSLWAIYIAAVSTLLETAGLRIPAAT